MASSEPEPFTITLTRRAIKDIAGLDAIATKRAAAAINALAQNPRPAGCLKIVSEEGLWRIRVGDYRIAYQINDAARTIDIARVGHRSDFYE